VAAAGRLFPTLTRGLDPVLLGTGVNFLVLVVSFARSRGRSRLPATGYRTS